jgi:hypothetical protein
MVKCLFDQSSLLKNLLRLLGLPLPSHVGLAWGGRWINRLNVIEAIEEA